MHSYNLCILFTNNFEYLVNIFSKFSLGSFILVAYYRIISSIIWIQIIFRLMHRDEYIMIYNYIHTLFNSYNRVE